MRARYYDPAEGRFLSTDPIGFPDGTNNGYIYVANRPEQAIDPLGLSATMPWMMRSPNAIMEGRSQPSIISGIVNGLLLNVINFAFDELSRQGAFGAPYIPSDVTEAGLPGPDQRGSACHPIFKPQAPGILPLSGRIHGDGLTHDRAIQRRIIFLRAYNIYQIRFGRSPSYLFITKNQNQKNWAQYMVSTCRLDLQYNVRSLAHFLEEYFRPYGALATAQKARVMQWSDPLAAQLFRIVR